MTVRPRVCPFCRSTDTLPFEHDTTDGAGEDSLLIPLLAGGGLLAAAAALLLTGIALGIPLAVFMVVVAGALTARRMEQRRRGQRPHRGNRFVCLSCQRPFTVRRRFRRPPRSS